MPGYESKKALELRITALERELDRCKRIESALSISEHQFEAIFNQSFQFALILDAQGTVIEFNDLCQIACGHLSDGVLGKPLWKAGWWVQFPEVQARTRASIQRVLKNEIVHDDVLFLDKDGQVRQGLRIFSPIKDDRGDIHLISVVGLDITEKKIAEQALKESERRYRFLLNSIPGTAYQFAVDADGAFRFEFIGEKCQDLFGLSAEELLANANRIIELIPEPDAQLVSRNIQASAAALTPYEVDHRVMKKDGDTRWVHASAIPRKLDNGDIIWDGIALDITERKLSEEDLKIYENIVSSTPDGIAFLDKNYRYIVINRSYELFSGVKRETLIGKTIAEYLGDDVFQAKIKSHLDRCLKGEVIKYQEWFDYPNLGVRFAEVAYFPYRDSENHIVGVVANTRDITEQKLAKDALERTHRQLHLRQKIAKSFLTCPNDRVFNGLLTLLQKEFESIYGYVGHIDKNGDLVCPSFTREMWPKCRMPEKRIVFTKDHWNGLWGESLRKKTTLLSNVSLNPPLGHVQLKNAIAVPLIAEGNIVGQIVLANKNGDYTVEDQAQLESLADFIAPVLKIYLEKEEAQKEIQSYTNKLEEKNIALKVLLENRTDDRKKLADKIINNFERLVFPYYEKLKTYHKEEDFFTIMKIVEENTAESLSPLGSTVASIYVKFTPMEIQVADLIKQGKTSKQISDMLNTSLRSVFFHRNNIRKKLNLQNKKTNLRTYLLSM